MTLLIVFLSLTNLALGYGLAIYLGHATPFWQETPTGGNAGLRSLPAVRQTARTQPAAAKPTESSPASAPATSDSATAATSETAPAEEVSLADSIKELEAFSGRLQEEAGPPAEEESPAAEPEADDQADHDELLKSIGDFQEQLKQQQELSKIPNQ